MRFTSPTCNSILPFLLISLPLALPGTASAAEPSREQFAALVEEIWQFGLREDPLFATSTGDHRYNDMLQTVSPEDSARRNQADEKFFERLEAIPRE